MVPRSTIRGQVFGGRRRTHGHADVAAGAHLVPGALDGLPQPGGQRRGGDPAADAPAGISERLDVVDVEVLQPFPDPLVEAIALQEFAVRGRRGCEAAGDQHAGLAQLADHFSQRRVLSADDVDVLHAKRFQLDDILLQVRLP